MTDPMATSDMDFLISPSMGDENDPFNLFDDSYNGGVETGGGGSCLDIVSPTSDPLSPSRQGQWQ